MPTAKPIPVGALTMTFHVDAAQSNGSLTVFEVDVPIGAHVPAPHSHDAFEETIFGLRGTTKWTVDGSEVAVGPGESVCIRRGVIHGFVNDSDGDATFLAIASPGIFGPEYFHELGAVLGSADGAPPDRDAVAAVMRRHGLTPADGGAPGR
jgi:quercetin dioxygenase-like cupin family protein